MNIVTPPNDVFALESNDSIPLFPPLFLGVVILSSLSLKKDERHEREREIKGQRGTKVRVFTAIAVISPRIEPCLSRSPPSRLMLIKSSDRFERDKR